MYGRRLVLLAALGCCLLQLSRCQVDISTVSTVMTPSPSVSPSTTVAPSSTTTTSSSSSSSSSGTMSPSPTLTPSPSPTSTPPPTPASKFVLTNSSKDACARVEVMPYYKFTYTNKTNHKITVNINASNLSLALDHEKSNCNDTEVVFVLTFHNNTNYNHTLTFHFTHKKDDKDYELKSICTTLDLNDTSLFPGYYNKTHHTLMGNTSDKIFSAREKHSYKCKSTLKYELTRDPKVDGEKLELKLSHFQAQAFNFTNVTGEFDKSSSCPQDQKTSKIVPIAVGAALAGLVVVVLIAYLIGRFRSRKQSSYEALS